MLCYEMQCSLRKICKFFVVISVFACRLVIYLNDDWKHTQGNILYGCRAMHTVMVGWLLVTLVVNLFCSPYEWLEEVKEERGTSPSSLRTFIVVTIIG